MAKKAVILVTIKILLCILDHPGFFTIRRYKTMQPDERSLHLHQKTDCSLSLTHTDTIHVSQHQSSPFDNHRQCLPAMSNNSCCQVVPLI